MTEDATEIVFTDIQIGIEKAIQNISGRPHHCARNAFRRIRQAWKLRSLDPEMAVFSAITAEEEAATALISALKERRYNGAEKLQLRSHPQKTGLIHMIHAVGRLCYECNLQNVKCSIQPDIPRIDIHLGLEKYGAPEGHAATPDEPLNLTISLQDGDKASPFNFEEQLRQIANKGSVETFEKFIKQQANKRNEVLYAAQDGIPHVQATNEFFQSRLRDVAILLGITLAVLQAKEPQPLGQQVLTTYLEVLDRLAGRGVGSSQGINATGE